MKNLPKVKIGIVAVSRDCFPESLSVNRRKALVEAYKANYDVADIYECPVCIVGKAGPRNLRCLSRTAEKHHRPLFSHPPKG